MISENMNWFHKNIVTKIYDNMSIYYSETEK